MHERWFLLWYVCGQARNDKHSRCIVLFIVKNHGIPESTITGALESVKEFFDLPLDSKMEVSYFQHTAKVSLMPFV